MPRRQDRDWISQLKRRLDGLGGTSLEPVALLIQRSIDVLTWLPPNDPDREEGVREFTRLIDLLPDPTTDRFHFDSQMIRGITDRWSRGIITCSQAIIPIYGSRWGHLPIRLSDGEHVYILDCIHTPCAVHDGAAPDLLNYPFMCHELGHYLLSRHGQLGRDLEETVLREVNIARKTSAAASLRARSAASETGNAILESWLPSLHGPWAIEVAIDIICLWTCGPAYIDALVDEAEERRVAAWQYSNTHPPIALRLQSLVAAAIDLGWGGQTARLYELLELWNALDVPAAMRNRAVALCPPSVLAACRTAAVALCEALHLPRMTLDELQAIATRSGDDDHGHVGAELISMAWSVWNQSSSQAYIDWEQAAYRQRIEV